MVGIKQNVCARQQNKQSKQIFCEIFVEYMHFVSVLFIVFASPFFDENYPKKIFPKALEDNHRDVLEFLLLFFWIYVETDGCDHRVHVFISFGMS